MPRSFNVAGPNKPDIHYTLDPESRLPSLRTLIDQQNYFVDSSTEIKGLAQLGNYLTKLGEKSGHLLVFDRPKGLLSRPERSWDEKIFRCDNVALPPPLEHLQASVWGL